MRSNRLIIISFIIIIILTAILLVLQPAQEEAAPIISAPSSTAEITPLPITPPTSESINQITINTDLPTTPASMPIYQFKPNSLSTTEAIELVRSLGFTTSPEEVANTKLTTLYWTEPGLGEASIELESGYIWFKSYQKPASPAPQVEQAAQVLQLFLTNLIPTQKNIATTLRSYQYLSTTEIQPKVESGPSSASMTEVELDYTQDNYPLILTSRSTPAIRARISGNVIASLNLYLPPTLIQKSSAQTFSPENAIKLLQTNKASLSNITNNHLEVLPQTPKNLIINQIVLVYIVDSSNSLARPTYQLSGIDASNPQTSAIYYIPITNTP